MAKRNIQDLFDDLEDFIGSCKQQKLSSNRIIVPRDELLNQIREIQMKIPSEVEHSNKVMENRDMILSEARRKADAIVAEANNEAMRRVNDTEIMNMATEQARALIEQAQMKALEIITNKKIFGDYAIRWEKQERNLFVKSIAFIVKAWQKIIEKE